MASDNDNLLEDLEVDAPSVIGGSNVAPPTPGQVGDRVRDEAHGVIPPRDRPAPSRPEERVADRPDLTP